MQKFDKGTGFLIADPENDYLKKFPDYQEIIKSASSMILSSSGWRKIFSEDGNEESRTERISDSDYIIAALMAVSFTKFLKNRKDKQAVILLGMDSRFTGPAIADAMIRVLISENVDVRYLFITAAPEIMAYSNTDPDLDGFIYISASHNPIGHNGVKFGAKGGVYGGEESRELISIFKSLISSTEVLQEIEDALRNYSKDKYLDIIKNISLWKKKSFDEYLAFSKRVIADSNLPEEISGMEER
ncbi:MAG: hypothetical protein L3J12_07740, partial [Spirochaetales bacterium]|nr:hypothetical protein [Spirochaetales bacterium]